MYLAAREMEVRICTVRNSHYLASICVGLDIDELWCQVYIATPPEQCKEWNLQLDSSISYSQPTYVPALPPLFKYLVLISVLTLG